MKALFIWILAFGSQLLLATPKVADWKEVFSELEATDLEVLPQGHDFINGLTSSLIQLEGSDRLTLLDKSGKLSLAEITNRNRSLRRYLGSQFPQLDMAGLVVWARPLYREYVSTLSLQGSTLWIGRGYAEHRALLLALNTILVLKAKHNGNGVRLAWNQFSALDPQETALQAGFVMPDLDVVLAGDKVGMSQSAGKVIPKTYDMRAKGMITPVKNQGSCPSCWAFTAMAVLEGAAALKFGRLVSLSEQEIVSCATAYGVGGCSYGNPVGAWAHAATSPVVAEKVYPYVSGTTRNGEVCQPMPATKRLVKGTSSFTNLQSEDEIKAALVNFGPVAIAIAAGSSCFRNYQSGIIGPGSCECSGSVNHSVTVVGWGEGYWIIKNSWGTGWGEKGYARLAMGVAGGTCRMMAWPVVPDFVGKTPYFGQNSTPVKTGK